jgi:hypothetical protein
MTQKDLKICKSCKTPKEQSAFGKHKVMIDGLQSRCKDCVNAYLLKWRHDRGFRVRKAATPVVSKKHVPVFENIDDFLDKNKLENSVYELFKKASEINTQIQCLNNQHAEAKLELKKLKSKLRGFSLFNPLTWFN